MQCQQFDGIDDGHEDHGMGVGGQGVPFTQMTSRVRSCYVTKTVRGNLSSFKTASTFNFQELHTLALLHYVWCANWITLTASYLDATVSQN